MSLYSLCYLYKTLKDLETRLKVLIVRKNIGYKVLLTLIGLLAVVFYDISIPIINGIIQLKINILGFFLEPLLQWIFGIPLRQAQIISTWIYLLIATLLFWYLFTKAYQALLVIFRSARQSWVAKNRWQKIKVILLIMLVISGLVKLVMIFV